MNQGEKIKASTPGTRNASSGKGSEKKDGKRKSRLLNKMRDGLKKLSIKASNGESNSREQDEEEKHERSASSMSGSPT